MSTILPDLLDLCADALTGAEKFLEQARVAVGTQIKSDDKIDRIKLDAEQYAAHGFAWSATYVEALRQMLAWGRQLQTAGQFGEPEQLILQAAYGEYLNQLATGLAMSQGEIVRPADMYLDDTSALESVACLTLRKQGNTHHVRNAIVDNLKQQQQGRVVFEDDSLNLIQTQFHRFADEQIMPYAHDWHLKNELIPLSLIEKMSELGVFGITIPEELGGLGMSKQAMCIVTEELSRAYIGVGSLGTRTDIAAELIMEGGTVEQREYWLPRIASGETIPTAVFTEPNNGSDLAGLTTRAVRDGAVYRINGQKTWITHAARADLMTLLVRTNPDKPGYQGLSMMLAEKPRGTDDNPFPAKGMSGSEIEVLGYRGMKEYEISFDNFEIPAASLLGGEEGLGFKQLMRTFESARIQTGARAVGIARNAMELGTQYALERVQFGQPTINFPRVSGKLAWMVVETMIARQMAYFAARTKDDRRRCDIEAGMAKLLAARVAWSNADNALQIHGGNGYAQEYPISRVLCDARIMNIFEGAAEIQANIIARGCL